MHISISFDPLRQPVKRKRAGFGTQTPFGRGAYDCLRPRLKKSRPKSAESAPPPNSRMLRGFDSLS